MTNRKPIHWAFLLSLVALLLAGPALAPMDVTAQGPTDDPAELEAFLDELMAKDMEEHHIAGAAVAVVKDGELFFAKGYGYADVENGTPVDPEKTLFRLASNSKPFTWTAVMQLVEQGKLDLDADINTYLDFEIPDTYPEPVTLGHLMAHTAGFECLYAEILAQDADDLVPAGEWLASHIPAQVRPPGDYAGYTTNNADLAGYIVARVAGVPFDQYIQENILDPLGMAYSSAQTPLPPELNPYLSVSYTYKDGAFQIYHPDYLAQPAAVPGAGMAASATDMARFMIAHLQDGLYSDEKIAETRILEEATAQQMHSTLFTPDPRLLGNAHGLIDISDNGQWTIGHYGGAAFSEMNNGMLLLPDQDLGVFFAYNSTGSAGPLTTQHMGLMRAFFDHYYPPPEAAPIEPPADFAERAGRFTGSYRNTQSSYTTIEKVLVPFVRTATISDPGDGTLLFSLMGHDIPLVEVEPLHFRTADGQFGFVFREDDQGRITHAVTGFAPQWTLEKLSWYETLGFHMPLALGCALVFLSVLIVALIGFIRDRRRGGDREPALRGARVAWWIAVGISVLNLLFLGASIGTVFFGNPVPFYGVSLFWRLVLLMALLAAVLTIGALVYTVLAWTGLGDPQRRPYWGIAGRVYYTLVTVAAVAFVWFLNSWNLLGWRF